jgi:hypothetical protein
MDAAQIAANIENLSAGADKILPQNEFQLRPMSEEEKTELATLETVIEEGLEVFRRVGIALIRIRDAKLYRDEFKTFGAYCETRWKTGRSHAYELMDAAQIANNLESLSPRGDKILPQNEFQLRPLTKVLPEDQPKVWNAAVEAANGQQPTMEQVEAAVKILLARNPSEITLFCAWHWRILSPSFGVSSEALGFLWEGCVFREALAQRTSVFCECPER